VKVAIFVGAAGASLEVAGFFDGFNCAFETLEALGRSTEYLDVILVLGEG